jgi:hypothetical protein
MFTLSLTLLLVPVSGTALPPIPVAVFAPGSTDSLVNQIWAEAAGIWKSAGIAFEWHRVGSEEEGCRWPLEVTIDDRRTSVEPGNALGWITFTANSPDRFIHLSRVRAEDMARTTPGLADATIASHEVLIGRALGRALAHELGHYLLRSKVHTSRGLMRGAWTADDSFGSRRNEFELTPEQRQTASGHQQVQKPAS